MKARVCNVRLLAEHDGSRQFTLELRSKFYMLFEKAA